MRETDSADVEHDRWLLIHVDLVFYNALEEQLRLSSDFREKRRLVRGANFDLLGTIWALKNDEQLRKNS